jgi:16S rRNA (cytosine967-C5)-methyltransferase
VVVDAPCTGIGTWRRNPDTKWRVRPGALDERMKDQDLVLARAERLVKPGGRIAYITCSVLRDENDDAVSAFLGRHDGFAPVAPAKAAAAAGLDALANRTSPGGYGLQLTPLRTGTDGFFFALLRRT